MQIQISFEGNINMQHTNINISMPAPSSPLGSSSSVFCIHANTNIFLKIGKCKYTNTQIQTSPCLLHPPHSPQVHSSFIFMQIQNRKMQIQIFFRKIAKCKYKYLSKKTQIYKFKSRQKIYKYKYKSCLLQTQIQMPFPI